MNTDKLPSSPVQKRILLWGGLLLGATLLCCILIIVLAPKVINRDTFRARIEAAISGTLGGTVIYDRLDLVLFPQPELMFSDLKIDIPRTGSIAIDTVDIYAKLIPLLLGRFDISSVTLDRPVLHLNLPGDTAKSGKPSSRKAEPAGRSSGDILTFAASAMPDLSLKISRGRISLKRGGQPVFSLKDMDAVLAFAPISMVVRDHSGSTTAIPYRVSGKAKCTIDKTGVLPGPLTLSVKKFDALPDLISFSQARAQLLDTDVSLNGTISGYHSPEPRPDITLSGSLGQNTITWLQGLAGLPEDLAIHAPIAVSKARLRTSGTGTARSQILTSSLSVQPGTTISLDLRSENGRISIERLQVKDQESDAALRFISTVEGRDLSFTGNLAGSTIERIADVKRITFGWIKGDMRIHLTDDGLANATAEGTLEGERIMLPSVLRGEFLIDRFTARTDGRTLLLQPAVLSLGKDILKMQGAASLSDNGLTLDLDVEADRISIRALQELSRRDAAESGGSKKPAREKILNVDGELRLHAAALIVDRYSFDDLSMVLTLGKDRTTVAVPMASICGIGLNGTVLIEDRIVDLTVQAKVRGGMMENSIQCILLQDPGVSGPYDLSGRFMGRGPWDALSSSLRGEFELSSKQGRIHSKQIVKGVIAYLNSTSMFKGSRSDLLEKGFSYDAIALRGTLREGVLNFSQATIRSKEIHITAEGDVDLKHGALALNVLAAPFTTFDRLMGKIPLVKHIAGNALIVVPARVEGTFSDPKVTPLALDRVGTNITNIMKNIAQTPVRVTEPNAPEERKKERAAAQE